MEPKYKPGDFVTSRQNTRHTFGIKPFVGRIVAETGVAGFYMVQSANLGLRDWDKSGWSEVVWAEEDSVQDPLIAAMMIAEYREKYGV